MRQKSRSSNQQPQWYRQQGWHPQYQEPIVHQPIKPIVHQPIQHVQQPRSTQSSLIGFIKKRDNVLLVSMIIALIWFFIVCSSFSSLLSATPTGSDAEQLGQEIGTAIGFVLQIPFLITSFLALVFNILGWFLSKKGFALTAGILFSVSFFFSIGNGFGYIPCLVLCFIGYSRLKKRMA